MIYMLYLLNYMSKLIEPVCIVLFFVGILSNGKLYIIFISETNKNTLIPNHFEVNSLIKTKTYTANFQSDILLPLCGDEVERMINHAPLVD